MIAATGLTVTEPSRSVHTFTYDTWSDEPVTLSTTLLQASPRSADSPADATTPATTTYLWPGLVLIHADWAADVAGAQRLTGYARADPEAGVALSTPSGASTTLRVLDTSGSNVLLGYVDATAGVTDIVTTDSSWGTRSGIDVRD